jgi:acyl-coenzyme A thioesterase PaaI-like protein
VNPQTHLAIDRRLVGEPLELDEGKAVVTLITQPEMAADDRGLIHGGFVFGLADYAAMLAVNHPNVVLSSSQILFKKPVQVGDLLSAHAAVEESDGRNRRVRVDVLRREQTVMTGTFNCIILERHVFDREERP